VIDGGEFDTQRNSKGMYRWTYLSPGGAEYVGPTWYRTKKKALEAGRDWLDRKVNP
jgi:hypothetical protein